MGLSQGVTGFISVRKGKWLSDSQWQCSRHKLELCMVLASIFLWLWIHASRFEHFEHVAIDGGFGWPYDCEVREVSKYWPIWCCFENPFSVCTEDGIDLSRQCSFLWRISKSPSLHGRKLLEKTYLTWVCLMLSASETLSGNVMPIFCWAFGAKFEQGHCDGVFDCA